MTPLRLPQLWTRRLYTALSLIALSLVVPFGLLYFGFVAIPETLAAQPVAVGLALLSLIMSFAGIIFVSKLNSPYYTLTTYILLLLASAYTLWQTGEAASVYTALWSILVFAAPVFGAFGWLPVIIILASFVGGAYLGNDLNAQTIIILIISSATPLLAGLVLWHHISEGDPTANRNIKNLATELSEVATKSEIVINAIGDGVIAIDGKGVIQLINPAAQEILGWGKQDALQLNYKSILKLTDDNNKELEPSADPLQQVLNTNQQVRGSKLSALTNSGKKISVSLVVSPIGEPGSGAIAVFRDVTKERAEEREQAEFISTASHEMRTPVASIEGYLGLAMNPNTATIDARGLDFIQKAHQAAQHLGRLFQDLLDVSKSEDGRMTNTPKVTDIVPFTQTIIQGLAQKAADKNLQLIFSPTDSAAQKKIMPVYYVNLDNDHVREVLDNLIENAIKYTPKGSVTVDVSGGEGTVVISIKDTGLGIPTEDIPHLFQKFYRVSNLDRQEIGGTGLGLYLSRRLVESMQGRLWVESIFGQGSTFFVELPRISSQEANSLQARQAEQPQQAQQLQQVQPQQTTQLASTPPVVPAPPAVAVQPPPAPTPAQPATSVPRGETLSREQIAERVRQLELLAQQQREAQAAQAGQAR